jgi:hypothetical protein
MAVERRNVSIGRASGQSVAAYAPAFGGGGRVRRLQAGRRRGSLVELGHIVVNDFDSQTHRELTGAPCKWQTSFRIRMDFQ